MDEETGIPYEIDPAVQKKLLVDIKADLGIKPDNLEATVLLRNENRERGKLVLVSDNNFNENQKTQFVYLELEFDTMPIVTPTRETPKTVDNEDLANEKVFLAGDSDDPAIWVHPAHPRKSLVIATMKDGGLVVFELKGRVRQKILPTSFGDIRFNNVDLVYAFLFNDGTMTDIAVVTHRENDTFAIFSINPNARKLTDITSKNIPEILFGIDDGEATAYGLATYTSPIDGRSYVFVNQADGNLVLQLELIDDGRGHVSAEQVRMIELPVPTGNPEDSQAEGMVVDRELGYLYVALEQEVGILKFDAEPQGSSAGKIVVSVGAPFLLPDIEGLSICYGRGKDGFLLASSQGDSSFAVFECKGNNKYRGRVTIGNKGDIDQTNESDSADVINILLGPDFPYGLMAT